MIDFQSLNANIAKVNKIISSKYSFMFMDLSKEEVENTDLMMSILQARIITEGMCRFIVIQEHLVKDEKSIRKATLRVYVEELLRTNLIVPKTIMSDLSTIQGKSNLAVHYQVEGHLELKDAYICLESLELVLDWFVKRYSDKTAKNLKLKINSDKLYNSGDVPAKSEGCILSRKREVGEIRSIIVEHNLVILRGPYGIGKTELAKDYVKKYRKDYDGIYYAENIDELDDLIYDLPIGIVDEDLKSKKEIVEEKLDVVHSMELTYLFILDNYTGEREELHRLLPDSDDKYQMMLIVDDEYGSWYDDKECYYEIKAFPPMETLQLFRYFCVSKFDDEEVMRLLSYLSYNPKAIKMSAVFLRDNDSFSPDRLINSMRKNTSVKSIIPYLYTILTEYSILESDKIVKLLAGCLSLIPYNGVSKERFINLFQQAVGNDYDSACIDEGIGKLERVGWVSIDKRGLISMNALLSDTIFEKIQPDMTSSTIVKFVSPIVEPTKNIRELYISQVIALEPFIDHLIKRALSADKCDLSVLNGIREYYIAVYNIPKIDSVTELMEREFRRLTFEETNIVEEAIYRQGISRFNLEDFKEAHVHFARALEMLNNKKVDIERIIARISAYEGSSLAMLGEKESAIESVKRSIQIREKLGKSACKDEEKALWISHYNYAKVLLTLGMLEEANKEIDISTALYKHHYPEIYNTWKSTNVSSLFQLKGRILAGLGKYEDAIGQLEAAKKIREQLKGAKYFSTAQVYASLMDVYCMNGDYEQALNYAELYYNVLILQHKTDDMKAKLKEVEEKIKIYKERLHNAEI